MRKFTVMIFVAAVLFLPVLLLATGTSSLIKDPNNKRSENLQAESAKKTSPEIHPNTSNSIKQGWAELREGVYGVPLDANLAQVLEWSRKYKLSVIIDEASSFHMDTRAETVAKFSRDFDLNFVTSKDEFVEELKRQSKELRDKENSSSRENINITKEDALLLDEKLSKLKFEYSDGGKDNMRHTMRARDSLNALSNPRFNYGDHDDEYCLEPVFHFGPDVIEGLFGENITCDDERIFKKTCMFHFNEKSDDILSWVEIYFIKTSKSEWKSYAALACFDFMPIEQYDRIIDTLNKKYGACITKPDDNTDVIFGVTDYKADLFENRETEMVLLLKHLIGGMYHGFVADLPNGNSILTSSMWKNNVIGRDLQGYNVNFKGLLLLYYSRPYAQEIMTDHFNAFGDAKKRQEKETERANKQLQNNF